MELVTIKKFSEITGYSEEAIRQHAEAADLAVSEIIPIADTVVVRPDPD